MGFGGDHFEFGFFLHLPVTPMGASVPCCFRADTCIVPILRERLCIEIWRGYKMCFRIFQFVGKNILITIKFYIKLHLTTSNLLFWEVVTMEGLPRGVNYSNMALIGRLYQISRLTISISSLKWYFSCVRSSHPVAVAVSQLYGQIHLFNQ